MTLGTSRDAPHRTKPTQLASQIRSLSANELYASLSALGGSSTRVSDCSITLSSYFLPSREYGMNDAFRK